MNLAIGSSIYQRYNYMGTTSQNSSKAEKLSVGKGKLTQEEGRRLGRHFDAISKYGDTLEISKAARDLLMGKEVEDVEPKTELNIEPAIQAEKGHSISTFDFSITDDMIYANL